MQSIQPQLSGIPETLLWTLRNRAVEAMRKDGILKDPKAIEIYQSIDYDFEKNFGKAEPSHAVRALAFDAAMIQFLSENPSGTIVNLAEGLETQRFRIPHEQSLWYSVDLPETIAIREKFILPDQQHIHLSMSAFEENWLKEIPKDKPVFISAQGLLMYFEEEKTKWLLNHIADYFPQAILMFDTVPVWFSRLTQLGWLRHISYTIPVMPWGIGDKQIIPTLKDWESRIKEIEKIPYRYPRGFLKLFFKISSKMYFFKDQLPMMLKVGFGA